jgi:hypothetical protein
MLQTYHGCVEGISTRFCMITSRLVDRTEKNGKWRASGKLWRSVVLLTWGSLVCGTHGTTGARAGVISRFV